MNQPTRCNNFSSLLLDVYIQLNMLPYEIQRLITAFTSTHRPDKVLGLLHSAHELVRHFFNTGCNIIPYKHAYFLEVAPSV